MKYTYGKFFMVKSMLRTLSIWNSARIVLDPAEEKTRERHVFLSLRVFRNDKAHAGVLLVSQSLPNTPPTRLAHARHRWEARHAGTTQPFQSMMDFLTP
jgi:hypothetical protein